MTQRALDDRSPSVPKTCTSSKGQPTLAEKCKDPKYICWVSHSPEQVYPQKWDIKEREGERQRERVNQDRLGVILGLGASFWLRSSLRLNNILGILGIGRFHNNNGKK